MSEKAVAGEPMPALETFANSYPGRNYLIEIRCPEFTTSVRRPANLILAC